MSALRSLLIALPLLLAVLAHPARAQTVTAGPDSAQVAAPDQSDRADSLRRTERLLGLRVTRPQKAALLALVLPGAGQVYNHKYWKLPLVYGALGGVGYGLYFYQKAYKEYAQGKNELARGVPLNELSGARVRRERSAQGVQTGLVGYRRFRDTFIAYAALAYGITILDALVDAHLRNFDISDDLGLRLDPALLPTQTAAPRTGLALTLYLK